MPNWIADSSHLCCAGRNEETSHFLGLNIVFFAEFLLGHHGSYFHGLTNINDVRNQIRKAHAYQTHNRRASGRNHRIVISFHIAHAFANRTGYNICTFRYLKHIVKAHVEKPLQHLRSANQMLELPVKRRCRKRNFVFETVNAGQRICLRVLGVIFTHTNTLAAVNTALINNVSAPAAHANGFRRTAF